MGKYHSINFVSILNLQLLNIIQEISSVMLNYSNPNQGLLQQFKSLLFCQKPDHYQEPLDYICIDPECKPSDHHLCCYICQQDPSHHEHEMASIKILLYKLLDVSEVKEEALRKSAELDLKIIHLLTMLQRNEKQITDWPQINETYHQYAALVKKRAAKPHMIMNQLQKIPRNSSQTFQSLISPFLRENYCILETDDEENLVQVFPSEKMLRKLLKELADIENQIVKMEKSDKISDYGILSLFQLSEDSGLTRPFKLYFTENLKASCMSVEALKAQMISSGSQRVVGMQPSLESNSKIKKWKINITKLVSWIGVGACHINKLKQADWHFNYSNTGHGSYFISSNGYSWSSYKPEYNSKYEPFTFKTGDVIILQYNPKQKLLKFAKENTEQTYSLQIESNGDPLHPAVNLTSIGDCVEVVQ